MSTLTIALTLARPSAGTEFSYVTSEDGRTVAAQGSAALALLPRADALVLVVPARALSWHAVKLPPMVTGRQRAALDGMLEDRLLDDPSTLALALSPQRRPDGTHLVAACDRAWLAGVLQLFEQGGRPASRVVPQWSPRAGAEPPVLVVSGTEDEAWLALIDADAVVCVPLAQARQLLLAEAVAGDATELLAEPAVAQSAERMLGRPAMVLPAAQMLLQSGFSQWELAQFDLATTGRGRMARRWAQAWVQLARGPRWRAARWGLGLALIANLVGLNAWAWRLDTNLVARRTQVRQVLTQAFPQVKTVVDAPLQMEREVALLRQSSGALSARDLEAMLSATGNAIAERAMPVGLEFSAGQLTVKGLALDPAQLDLASGKLSALGYSARAEGERLIVRAGGRP